MRPSRMKRRFLMQKRSNAMTMRVIPHWSELEINEELDWSTTIMLIMWPTLCWRMTPDLTWQATGRYRAGGAIAMHGSGCSVIDLHHVFVSCPAVVLCFTLLVFAHWIMYSVSIWRITRPPWLEMVLRMMDDICFGAAIMACFALGDAIIVYRRLTSAAATTTTFIWQKQKTERLQNN